MPLSLASTPHSLKELAPNPNSCKVKQNITQFWRQHFVLHENMLEMDLKCWL